MLRYNNIFMYTKPPPYERKWSSQTIKMKVGGFTQTNDYSQVDIFPLGGEIIENLLQGHTACRELNIGAAYFQQFPWRGMNNLLVMFAFFSSLWLTCSVTKNCLLKHPTAVEGITMTKPCKSLFNKTRFLYKLDNLLFQIIHISCRL